MTTRIDLIGLNTEAAEAIASPDAQFNSLAADLVLRNITVATDRLDPIEFSRLSETSVNAVLDTVGAAKELTPLATEDVDRLPQETEAEYWYRVSILRPLHGLQAKVHTGDFDAGDSAETDRLKAAVRLAGIAFASIIAETADNAAIRETERYFWGNTIAAARRAKVKATGTQK